jgi:hypothetical protein
MKLDKLGLVFTLESSNLDWMITHAEAPFLEQTQENDIFNLYFGTRNKENKSQIGRVKLRFDPPYNWTVLSIQENPVLSLGEPGCFDDSAIKTPWLISRGFEKYLFYTGWMEGKGVSYYPSIGLAKYDPSTNNIFRRVFTSPMIHRSNSSPIGFHSPCVIYDMGKYVMYNSNISHWNVSGNEKRSYYQIQKRTSPFCGAGWTEGKDLFNNYSIDNMAKPHVITEDGVYKMWYSYAIYGKHKYRIGYAESLDGEKWEIQNDKIEFDVGSKDSFDSEMMAYPFIFNHNGYKYMLYNGNNFGKEGIGYGIIYD